MNKLEEAFLKEMEGKQYGVEETNDARLWFTAGFQAGQTAREEELKAARDLIYKVKGSRSTSEAFNYIINYERDLAGNPGTVREGDPR